MLDSIRKSCLAICIITTAYCGQSLHHYNTLSDAEADAIILAEVASKAAEESARLAELNQAEILSEGVLEDNGRRIIIRQVTPPEAEPDSTALPALSPAPSADLSALPAKARRSLFLSATVYDRALTYLRWEDAGEAYEGWSNVDFNYLGGVADLETDQANYTLFMALGNLSTENGPEGTLPGRPVFPEDEADFVLTLGDPANLETLQGIEAVLAYYEANEESLQIAYQRREALQAARERYAAAHPEEPKDLIFQYWDREPEGEE
ncbi:MAG: hypothetical protein AAF546_00435 [Verrucomicrobiota bacterium]